MKYEDLKVGQRVICTDVAKQIKGGEASQLLQDNYIVHEITDRVIHCVAVVKAASEGTSPINSMFYGRNDLHLINPSKKVA